MGGSASRSGAEGRPQAGGFPGTGPGAGVDPNVFGVGMYGDVGGGSDEPQMMAAPLGSTGAPVSEFRWIHSENGGAESGAFPARVVLFYHMLACIELVSSYSCDGKLSGKEYDGYRGMARGCLSCLEGCLRDPELKPGALGFLDWLTSSPDPLGKDFADSYVVDLACEAVEDGHVEVVRAMVEMEGRLAEHEIVLDIAMRRDTPDVLPYLLSGADLSVPRAYVGEDGRCSWSPHHCAHDGIGATGPTPKVEEYLVERMPWLRDMWKATRCRCVPPHNLVKYE